MTAFLTDSSNKIISRMEDSRIGMKITSRYAGGREVAIIESVLDSRKTNADGSAKYVFAAQVGTDVYKLAVSVKPADSQRGVKGFEVIPVTPVVSKIKPAVIDLPLGDISLSLHYGNTSWPLTAVNGEEEKRGETKDVVSFGGIGAHMFLGAMLTVSATRTAASVSRANVGLIGETDETPSTPAQKTEEAHVESTVDSE